MLKYKYAIINIFVKICTRTCFTDKIIHHLKKRKKRKIFVILQTYFKLVKLNTMFRQNQSTLSQDNSYPGSGDGVAVGGSTERFLGVLVIQLHDLRDSYRRDFSL